MRLHISGCWTMPRIRVAGERAVRKGDDADAASTRRYVASVTVSAGEATK
jgi:hypothetical protein